MKQENEKWQDTDPRQKDDRSEITENTGYRNETEKNERLESEEKDETDDDSFWEGNGSDGGAAGDGSAA